MSDKPYTSPNLEHKKKRRRIFRLILVIIFLLTVIGSIIYWLNHSYFKISEISIAELQYSDTESVKEISNKILDEKYLGIISRRNIFLIPKDKIIESIKSSKNSIQDVSIEIININKISINIMEYSHTAKWCGQTFSTQITPCYLMNQDSLIFAKDDELDKKNIVKFFGQISGDDPLNTNFLDPTVFNKIINFLEYLPELDISPSYIETEDRESFSVHTLQGPYLLIDNNDEAIDIANNLKTVIEAEEINEVQLSNLEYIDLRFGKKVYYRIK